MSSNSMSISTLDNDVLASIRQAITNFLQCCGLQYMDIAINKACYSECCQEAISRGFPMDGNYSIRPYMGVGVAIMSNAYAHLPDCAIRMWICLFTTISTSIDDLMERGEDLVHLYRFNERFASSQPQGDPVLNALNVLLWDIACLYAPPVLNLIVASSLNFMSSIVLDNETKDMQISAQTPLYPEYSRLLLGLADAYGFFIFPSTLPLQKYVQCMPDLMTVINHTNDILSYYKEEIEGDTANYLLLMAASRALTKQDALHEVIKKTVRAYHNVLEFLRPQTEAYEAYVSFFDGYVKFHAALRRYKLEEIMWET
ncbi:isoprenoid synthase domain-containing protein [Suillus paluster]|uniref:isoprenoid synthase domain-containing protein n=1 Tax=Suillus paluster TaxID=48578 RepID=UPI001B877E53|nr:isoprenoid synthase domain-containing protein [Suillus paluster]KAG1736675.1 isoprenoid synthase domain-containing protein [Suillus paluster]